MKRKIMAVLAALVAAAAVVVLDQSPALAATCKARVNFGISGSTGSATEFNGQSAGDKCALVQVHMAAYMGSGITIHSYGPQSSGSSYVSAYVVPSYGAAWYGKAKPSTTWSEQQWYVDGQWKTFAG